MSRSFSRLHGAFARTDGRQEQLRAHGPLQRSGNAALQTNDARSLR